jgi:hypothetical protein
MLAAHHAAEFAPLTWDEIAYLLGGTALSTKSMYKVYLSY